jgi:threonine dehydrogenase-like Zn-dependent dehydrogenase
VWFGTVYEGLEKIGISGDDAVLVVGLGPVGLAALMLAKAMGANKLIGVDVVEDRLEVARTLALADHVLKSGPENVEDIRSLTGGHGVERAFDASGNDKGRLTAIQATRKWGKIALVGEGGTLALRPSPDMIHDQKTVYGSWVTSIWLMEDLVERIVRWKIYPENLVTNRFPLEEAGEAYALMVAVNLAR